MESAGLRRITFYHARHSALSYLLNSGQVPIAVVAAWAGHADGGATALKHYIRVRPGDLEAARDAIAAFLAGKRTRPDVRNCEKSAASDRS